MPVKYSGEEAAVDSLADMLRHSGQQVVLFRRSSAELRGFGGKIKAFFCGFYNPSAVKDFSRVLREEKPDIVHVHNLYPLISPAVLKVASTHNIPVVMTLHNYRLCCPNGLAFRGGSPCSQCLDHGEWSCVRNNCLGDRLKSVGYALRNWWARYKRYYLDYVSCFLALSEFQKNKLAAVGIPAEKIKILPNALSGDAEGLAPARKTGDYVAFAGRLSEEKGIDLLLNAAEKLPSVSFHLAGNGYEQWSADAPQNVVFCGHLSGDDFSLFWQNCRFLVLPSKCYEGFPTTLLQAMYYGKPAIVPDIGGLPEIIRDGINGRLFKFGDSDSLASAINELWSSPDKVQKMGEEGLQLLSKYYTAEEVSSKLLSYYEDVIEKTR